MTHRYIIDGQPLVYNAERKLGNTTIEEPFLKAGKIFGFTGPGIGLNPKLIEFILKRKATLLIYVASFRQNYWTTWDNLEWNYEKGFRYMAGGRKEVYVIPLEQFNQKTKMIA